MTSARLPTLLPFACALAGCLLSSPTPAAAPAAGSAPSLQREPNGKGRDDADGNADPADEKANSIGDVMQLPLDRVELRDGAIHEGLIESRSRDALVLLKVYRPKGRAMFCARQRFAPETIAHVEALDDAVREETREKVQAYLNRKETEQQKASALKVERTPDGAWGYRGEWFAMVSSADEEITRLAIVRMERVFAAYAKLLPPRRKPDRPLRIVFFGSRAEYRDFLQRIQLRIENPAFFDSEQNVVVAASDLARLTEELKQIHDRHTAVRKRYKELSDEVNLRVSELAKQARQRGESPAAVKAVSDKVRSDAQKKLGDAKSQLDVYDRKNQLLFTQHTKQLFSTLYHEAFHAYLENHVYRHDQADVPRWLNEGLAQVFENGFMEFDELRIDARDPEGLKRLRDDRRGDSRLRLVEILTADQNQYLVASRSDAANSSRHYLYAWGLSYYLALERKSLKGAALDQFVARDKAADRRSPTDAAGKPEAAAATNAQQRLEALVGMPLPEFEAQFRAHFLKLGVR